MVSGRLEWLIAVSAGLQENRTKAVEQELELKRTCVGCPSEKLEKRTSTTYMKAVVT
jgi:hypothetical protein